ncbi:hypothetical protein L211DRAFT_871389, partial [Terfezia boudieri ATCC MYA-4762]
MLNYYDQMGSCGMEVGICQPLAHFSNVESLSQSMTWQTPRSILKESQTIHSLTGNYFLSLKPNSTCQ